MPEALRYLLFLPLLGETPLGRGKEPPLVAKDLQKANGQHDTRETKEAQVSWLCHLLAL